LQKLQNIPLKITAIYVSAGALWILLSGGLLQSLAPDPSLITRLTMYKGWAFIAVTAVVLYRLLARDHAKILRSTETVRKQERENVAYQNRLRFMGAEILLIEERERRQLATTLHDQIGQVLALAKIKLGALQAADSAEERRQLADEIRELLAQAITSSRTLTFELSPPILYELGFESAVQALCERFQQKHGLRIEFVTDRTPKTLPDDMRIILFRAVRELLVNIVKHAQAGSVQVSCQRINNQIILVVADDGIGFEPAATVTPSSGSSGFGLFSNRERLHHLGGEMTIESSPGRGTRVILAAQLQESSTEGDIP
jgi:signal transduction histidine kinase